MDSGRKWQSSAQRVISRVHLVAFPGCIRNEGRRPASKKRQNNFKQPLISNRRTAEAVRRARRSFEIPNKKIHNYLRFLCYSYDLCYLCYLCRITLWVCLPCTLFSVPTFMKDAIVLKM